LAASLVLAVGRAVFLTGTRNCGRTPAPAGRTRAIALAGTATGGSVVFEADGWPPPAAWGEFRAPILGPVVALIIV